MPEANEMVVGLMAVVAQAERQMISRRTKEALAAAKARGVRLGGDRGNLSSDSARGRPLAIAARQMKARERAADLAPVIADLRREGISSASAIARALTARAIPTSQGRSSWSPVQVSRLLDRLADAGVLSDVAANCPGYLLHPPGLRHELEVAGHRVFTDVSVERRSCWIVDGQR